MVLNIFSRSKLLACTAIGYIVVYSALALSESASTLGDSVTALGGVPTGGSRVEPVTLNAINDYLREAEQLTLPLSASIELSEKKSAFAYRIEPPAKSGTSWSVDYRLAENASSAVVLQLVTISFDKHNRVLGFDELLKKNALGDVVIDEVLWPREPVYVIGSANPTAPGKLTIESLLQDKGNLQSNGAYIGNTSLVTSEPVSTQLEFTWAAPDAAKEQPLWDVKVVTEPGTRYELFVRSGAQTRRAVGAEGENLSYKNLPATNGPVKFTVRPIGKVFSPVSFSIAQQSTFNAKQERELEKPMQLIFSEPSLGEISHLDGTGVERPEIDTWLITVPSDNVVPGKASGSAKPINIRITASNTANTVIAKLKYSGRSTPLFAKSAKGELTSGPLLLQPRQYLLEVSASEAGTGYQVQVSWATEQSDNSEKEPNNSILDANVITPGKVTKGELSAGTDDDFFLLDTSGTGAAQYWRLIATGGGVERMAIGSKYWIAAHPDDNNPVLSINYMLLLPGEHPIKLSGDGRYSFRAIPLGPPKPGFETEPNDGKLGPSERLVIGDTARGSLDKAIVSGGSDVDQYRFRVPKRGKYRITLVSPDDQGLRARLYVNGDKWFSHQQDTTAGSTLEYAALLLAGEYTIELTNQDKTRALDEYSVRVEKIAESTDVYNEPNDIVSFATPLKNSTTVNTRLGAFDHSDCYAMAPTTQPSTLDISLPAKYKVAFLDQFSRSKSKLVSRDTTNKARWSVKPLANTLFICISRDWSVVDARPYTLTINKGDSSELPQAQFATSELPDAFRGGLNVAWGGLGARWEPIAEGLTPKEIDYTLKKLNRGINNISPLGAGVEWDILSENANNYRLNLAGNDSVPLVGVVVNTRTGQYPRRKTRHFRLLVSEDGHGYTEALRGELSFSNNDQYFAFDEPVSGRYIKFLPLDSFQSRSPHYARIQELKLIASPSFALRQFDTDLASVPAGGHIVRHDFKTKVWNNADAMDAAILDTQKPQAKNQPLVCQFLPKMNRAEWVMGFHHNRAARVTQLHYRSDASAVNASHFKSLTVSVSARSPLGPWREVALWDTQQLLASPILPLTAKPWVRFVKFVATGEPQKTYQCPGDLIVTEAPVSQDYRSILGEWSEYDSAGPFEAVNAQRTINYLPQGGATVDTAVNITPAQTVKSSVKRERNNDWFLFKSDTNNKQVNSLLINVAHPVSFKPRIDILDGSGNPLQTMVHTAPDNTDVDSELASSSDSASNNPSESLPYGWTSTQYTVWRSDSANYSIHIQEPPRNVVLTWDSSGSMGPQLPYIEMASRRWADYLKPEHEFAKVMQFGGKSEPENEWASLPHMLQAALHSVSAKVVGSSDAENSLLDANELLAPRYGNHAVVTTTDGEFRRSPAFWKYLNTHCSNVYGVGLRGSAPSEDFRLQSVYQDNFQNWVSACGGYYRYCDNVTCLEDFYKFAAQDIRKPKPYELSVSEVYRAPPRPGLLNVEVGAKTLAATAKALYVILDASGSMLQQLEGSRRIDIAKTTLKAVVRDSIGKHNHFGLRTFGLQAGECSHTLALPIAKHSANSIDAAIDSIAAVNQAKTPIAASLEAAAIDLGSFNGEKLIVLLTDGEETCDGDSEVILNSLRAKDIDIKMHIVGFALDDDALIEQFKSWAVLGGGEYYNASNQGALQVALRKAVTPRFQVKNGVGDIVLTAHVGDTSHALPPGDYQVALPDYPEVPAMQVSLEAEGKKSVIFE